MAVAGVGGDGKEGEGKEVVVEEEKVAGVVAGTGTVAASVVEEEIRELRRQLLEYPDYGFDWWGVTGMTMGQAGGACVSQMLGHTGAVCSVAYSPDGLYAVSGSGDKTIRVWLVESGELVRTLKGHTSAVMNSLDATRPYDLYE